MASDTITLTIDGHEVTVPKGSTIMQAAKKLGTEIPSFCFHERLSVAGSCRMCLVEVEGAPKPVASCHWPAADGMEVYTQSETTRKAQKATMELLLINHPLDCPVCDQGGECELQDIATAYGADRTHYCEKRREVGDKEIGAKIKTVMTRCIHCTRCVRFATEIAGVEEFGGTFRGENLSIGTYVEHTISSELSGNMIDLCPVGAITSKPYAYTARPWELKSTNSIDINDATGSHIRLDSRAGEVMRIVPNDCEDINEEWIPDTTRFSYDALKNHRLTNPKVGGISCGWEKALDSVKAALKGKRKDKIGAIIGNQQCAEGAFAFKALMQDVIGTPNLNNSLETPELSSLPRSAYTLNTPIAELENADAVLLVGTNPRYEAPMLNLRLRKAVRNNAAQVANIGVAAGLTYPTTQLGEGASTLEDLVKSKATTGFAKALKSAKNAQIIIGTEALMHSDAKAVLKLCSDLAEKYSATVNFLPRHAGEVSVLDFKIAPQKDGKNIKELEEAALNKKLDVLFIYGDVPFSDYAAKCAKTTIYIGTHNSALAKAADIILPAAAFSEKSAFWANMEGRVQESNKAVEPPLNAKEDWKIFRALSATLGKPLNFDTQAQLRAQMAKTNKAYGDIGQILPNPQKAVGKAGKVQKTPFAAPPQAQDFYQANPLLRNSPTMLKCAEEFASHLKQQEAA